MKCVLDICEVISAFSAFVAIFISVSVYRRSVRKERRIETIKNLSVIRKQYFNTKNLDNKEKLKYLNEMEFFATGVNEKIYDINIVNKMSGSRLIKQYDNWISCFIEERIDRSGNDNAYSEYIKMINHLKKNNRSNKGR